MTDGEPKVMGWGAIVLIMVMTGLLVGLILGLLGEITGSSGGAGVGAAIGVVGALLIARRRAALRAMAAGSHSLPK